MNYPVTYEEFKLAYPELITAAQNMLAEGGAARALFDKSLIEYSAMLGEKLVTNAFGLPVNATPEEVIAATLTNSLALASLVAGFIRQMNVENEFVPGYDGQDAGNNEANLQGLQNTLFNAQFSQNIYGRKYLNIVYRAGIPLELVAL